VGAAGGSVPEVRSELAALWGGEVHDRYGLTEAGPVAAECRAHPGGIHLQDDAFLAEVVDPGGEEPRPEGDEGELVLTGLGRTSSPIIRYRTGDAARLIRGRRCACGRSGTLLEGGVRRLFSARSRERGEDRGRFPGVGGFFALRSSVDLPSAAPEGR